jgi:hypothetical protein
VAMVSAEAQRERLNRPPGLMAPGLFSSQGPFDVRPQGGDR